jgi:CHAT domain-containing protein
MSLKRNQIVSGARRVRRGLKSLLASLIVAGWFSMGAAPSAEMSKSLFAQGAELVQQGDYVAAEPLLKKAWFENQKAPADLDTDLQNFSLYRSKAQEFRIRAPAERFVYRLHDFVASVQHNLASRPESSVFCKDLEDAEASVRKQKFKDAYDLFSAAEGVASSTFSPAERAELRWAMADTLYFAKDYSKALDEYAAASSEIERDFPKDALRADFLEQYGLCIDAGNYENRMAIPLFSEALELRKQILDADDPSTAELMTQIGISLDKLGCPSPKLLDEAEGIYLRFLAKQFGPYHLTSLRSQPTPDELQNAARIVARDGGNCESALRVYCKEVMSLCYALTSANDHISARNLSLVSYRMMLELHYSPEQQTYMLLDYAQLFEDESQFAMSEDALVRSFTLAESNNLMWPRLQSKYALARLALERNDLPSALRNANECMQLSELSGPTGIPFKPSILELEAEAAYRYGDVSMGYKLTQQALSLRSARSPRDLSATNALVLAVRGLRLAAPKSEDAENMARDLIQTLSRIDDPRAKFRLADAYSQLGEIQLSKGDRVNAETSFANALKIHQHFNIPQSLYVRLRESQVLSAIDAEKGDLQNARLQSLAQAEFFQENLESAFTDLAFTEQFALCRLISDHMDLLLNYCCEKQDIQGTYKYLMSWKGLLYRSMRWRTAYWQHLNEGDRSAIVKLSHLDEQLADAGLHNPRMISDKEAVEHDSLERTLLLKTPLKGLTDPVAGKGLSDLQKNLRASEVYIDLYRYIDSVSSEPAYCAFIVTRDSEPRFIRLGEASSIDTAIDRWRCDLKGQISGARGIPQIKKVRIARKGNREVMTDDPIPDKSRTLDLATERSDRLLVRQKLKGLIENQDFEQSRNILISAEGSLGLIPWNLVLTDPELQLTKSNQSTCISYVSSPREILSMRASSQSNKAAVSALLIGAIKFASAKDLPGTKTEIHQIARLISNHEDELVLDGVRPTRDEVLRQLGNREYIHLATHGYCTDDADDTDDDTEGHSVAEMLAAAQRNPLADSGLIMAPAVNDDQSRQDTLLSSLDILGKDLSSTRLVTLSACETGLGKPEEGQGVIGLRATMIGAGAKSLLMSLWSVNDEATTFLMVSFYNHLWNDKMPISRALAAAQEETRKKWAHPFYWAGWVLAGDSSMN